MPRLSRLTMPATLLSCGLLVVNEWGEVLLGHSTGSFHWDLPKGLIDPGESPLDCAQREAREEFGLAFPADRLVDLGRQPYYRGKDLHLFAVQTSTRETTLHDLSCTSFFEHPVTGQTMPEVDGFAWVDEQELGHRLARSMRALLLDRGLLAQARSRLTTTRPDHG
jgi:putative (di)nucleoside polyphosphate hydrolase